MPICLILLYTYAVEQRGSNAYECCTPRRPALSRCCAALYGMSVSPLPYINSTERIVLECTVLSERIKIIIIPFEKNRYRFDWRIEKSLPMRYSQEETCCSRIICAAAEQQCARLPDRLPVWYSSMSQRDTLTYTFKIAFGAEGEEAKAAASSAALFWLSEYNYEDNNKNVSCVLNLSENRWHFVECINQLYPYSFPAVHCRSVLLREYTCFLSAVHVRKCVCTYSTHLRVHNAMLCVRSSNVPQR